jgi:hypothetical protein
MALSTAGSDREFTHVNGGCRATTDPLALVVKGVNAHDGWRSRLNGRR